MFKRTNYLLLIALAAILGFVTSACNKLDVVKENPADGMALFGTKADAPADQFGLTEWDLIAGNPKNGKTVAGKVSAWNDAEYVYVKYETVDGWYMGATHLFIGPKAILLDPANGYVNGNGSLIPGHLPYTATFEEPVTEWAYALSLVELYGMFGLTPEEAEGVDICPVVAAHAEVFQIDENGERINGNTATGEGPRFIEEQGNWFMYSEGYCVVIPPDDPPTIEYAFKNETAWAFDVNNPLAYNSGKKGNWAKFIQYDGEALEVILQAGQKNTDVKVFLTPAEEGKVQIAIEGIVEIAPENDGKWVLQPEAQDAIKVQGYATKPSGNPAPGQFTYYKGRDLTFEVDAANFYGIHLDVAKLTVK